LERSEDGESLYDAWEKFKLLLKKCLNRKLDEIQRIYLPLVGKLIYKCFMML